MFSPSPSQSAASKALPVTSESLPAASDPKGFSTPSEALPASSENILALSEALPAAYGTLRSQLPLKALPNKYQTDLESNFNETSEADRTADHGTHCDYSAVAMTKFLVDRFAPSRSFLNQHKEKNTWSDPREQKTLFVSTKNLYELI